MRTPEQKAEHAAYERKYRGQKRQERDRALARLAEAAATLARHGYTVGQMTDLIHHVLHDNEGGPE